tara:strand:+ start:573 stop:1001 length:429 start_codon:yes stop_codon:yes gene_type:complete
MSDYESYDEVDELKNLDPEVFLNHPETAEILNTICYDNFENKMKHIIEHFYADVLNDCNNEYFNILEKDKYNDTTNNASYELFLIVYKYISKNHDLNIFYENPELANCLFKEEEESIVEKNKPKNIDKTKSRIFDWKQKTYK